MSKAETPSPHSSKKSQCGGCHSFMSELDPHPECNKCLQGQSLPSLCPPLPGYVEEMGAPAVHKEVLFDHEGAQGLDSYATRWYGR